MQIHDFSIAFTGKVIQSVWLIISDLPAIEWNIDSPSVARGLRYFSMHSRELNLTF